MFTEVRSFLSLAGCYQKFIKDFAEEAILLTRLTKKKLTFAWNEKSANPFETLKKLLTSAPMLTILDEMKPFTIYTDACGTGLRAILMQKGRAIFYVIRQLKDHEKRYPTMT